MEIPRHPVLDVNPHFVGLAPEAYKEFSPEKMLTLQNSLIKYGQLRPIIVIKDELDELLAIEGRKILTCLKQLNPETIKVLVVDPQQGLSIVMNELQFETNYIELCKIHGHEITDVKLKNIMPYTEDEIAKIRSISSFDWTTLVKKDNPDQETLIFE